MALPESFELVGFSGEEVSTDPDQRVPNVVLATGDDMTMLARFHSDEPEAFAGDLFLTLRYKALASASTDIFSRRVNIASALKSPGALMQRTQLIDRYGHLGCRPEEGIDREALIEDLQNYAQGDPGIDEVLELLTDPE